jgi:hypothetical protein
MRDAWGRELCRLCISRKSKSTTFDGGRKEETLADSDMQTMFFMILPISTPRHVRMEVTWKTPTASFHTSPGQRLGFMAK